MKFFKPEDFADVTFMTKESFADLCNQKLEREVMVVYGNKGISTWDKVDDCGYTGHYTHRALLICVEEIERKPCLHEAKILVGTDNCYASECIHCGAKLKPTAWEAVDALAKAADILGEK